VSWGESKRDKARERDTEDERGEKKRRDEEWGWV